MAFIGDLEFDGEIAGAVGRRGGGGGRGKWREKLTYIRRDRN